MPTLRVTSTLGTPPSARRTVSNPLDAEALRIRTQIVLDHHLDLQSQRLAPLGPDLAPLLKSIASLINGGKRLRPAFCYWGWRAAGGLDCDEIINAAASFEFFQAAALLHDDVMDDSDTRRGQPAAHRKMASLHAAQGWAGDGQKFGISAAVLAGDLCLSWSDELLSGSGLPSHALKRARPMFELMRTQLMGGQYLDVLEQVLPEAQGGGTVDRARRVIHYKSAKYTIEHPLLIGGLLAGASESVLSSYSAYALPLGEAFQLRDDLLGVFGDPDQTGKPAGDDLREGKRTVLIAHALTAANSSQSTELRAGLGRTDLDSLGVERLQNIIMDTGAVAQTEKDISQLVEQSQRALAEASITEDSKQVLAQLVTAATARVC